MSYLYIKSIKTTSIIQLGSENSSLYNKISELPSYRNLIYTLDVRLISPTRFLNCQGYKKYDRLYLKNKILTGRLYI